MKFALAILSTVLANAVATLTVNSGTKAASKLLSQARRLDGGDDAAGEEAEWIASYSLKYQGCHHVSQWSNNDDNDDVRIETKRLVRFRLCDSSVCSATLGSGCNSGYGDYIVDMNTYIAYYMENKQEVQQEACEAYGEANCAYCENDDVYYPEQCEQECFTNAGMSYCNEDEDDFNPEDYLECAAYEPANNGDDANRKLEDANAGYYIGPFCADQGGEILLGLFTDETCTNFADDYGGRVTYENLSGSSLPYSSKSLVDTNCYSCAEAQDNGDDGYYELEPKEFCEALYEDSGKCETYLDINNANTNACNYMEGIKMTTTNGIIISGAGRKNKVASAFIGIFAVTFLLLGSYVYYLKTKLDRVRINLSD